jgi:hypothetical protein
MRTSQKTLETITTIGIDLGKNTFHLVGLDKRGAIVLRLKVSRGQLGLRFSNVPRCLIGIKACSGSHHIARQFAALGQDCVDPGAVREAVPQGAQERLSRCRGDRGGRAATNYALCRDQDTGTDGPARSASRALAHCGTAGRRDQSDPRLSDRARITVQGVVPCVGRCQISSALGSAT